MDASFVIPSEPSAADAIAGKVEGCQSQVWIEPRVENGQVWFAGASDAAIVQGLVAMLLRVYSGRTPQEILATDPGFLKELDLMGNLSANRGNGVAALIRRIRAIATEAATQAA